MDNQRKRQVPVNDLDFNYMVTDTKWGKPDVSNTFQAYLSEERKVLIPAGVKYLDPSTNEEKVSDGSVIAYETNYLWDRLQFLTQDVRLGNLNPLLGEDKYCQYYLNLAGDLLQEGMKKSFVVALSRAGTVLEVSQSKGGFFRKNLVTFRHKQTTQAIEPPKKNLFGSGGKKQYGQG